MRKVLNGVVVLSGLLLLVACGKKSDGSKNLSAEALRGNWLVTNFNSKKIDPDLQSIVTVDGDLKFHTADVATNTASQSGSLTLGEFEAVANDGSGDVIIVSLLDSSHIRVNNKSKNYILDGERISDSEKASIIAAGRGR